MRHCRFTNLNTVASYSTADLTGKGKSAMSSAKMIIVESFPNRFRARQRAPPIEALL